MEKNDQIMTSPLLINLLLALFFIQIFLNFIGSPLVKVVFAVISIATFVCVLTQPFKKAIWILLIFSIFEGQGRIVWGYHPAFRLIFDILSLILVMRVIIQNKKIIDQRYFSKLTIIFLTLHFSWWVLELFNPSGAGFFASFITAKYYIFPFFLLMAFVSEGVAIKELFAQKMIVIIFIMMILISLLCFHQQEMKNELMTKVSPYYLSLFAKFKEFTGERFRPWGTSHSPGGMSIFNYLLVPLFFLFDPKVLAKTTPIRIILNGLSYAFILLSFAACFLSQVRSAFFKMILIFASIYLLRFLTSKFKLKQIVVGLLALGALGAYSPNFIDQDFFSGALGRFDQLSNEGVASQRSGPLEVYRHLVEKVEYPFGYGPGMTTGYSLAFQEKRDERVYTGAKHSDFWSLDNLYVFLFLEL